MQGLKIKIPKKTIMSIQIMSWIMHLVQMTVVFSFLHIHIVTGRIVMVKFAVMFRLMLHQVVMMLKILIMLHQILMMLKMLNYPVVMNKVLYHLKIIFYLVC